MSAFHNSYADLNHLLFLHIVVVANRRDSSLIYLLSLVDLDIFILSKDYLLDCSVLADFGIIIMS